MPPDRTNPETLRLSDIVQVDVAVTQDKVSDICGCRCHAPLALTTPGWIGNAIGSLLVQWYKSSKACERCSRGPCKVLERGALLTRYYFPKWAMWRLIELESAWTSSQMVSVSLRTARVIPDNSPIFMHVQHNNLDGVKRLFEQKLASPFDVSFKGRTPLHVSTRSRPAR